MGLLDRLRGVGQAPPSGPPPALDVCLGDPRARHLRGLLERGDWRPVATALERLDRREQEFYVQVLTDWRGFPPWIDEWWQATAGTSPLAWLVRGRHAIYWAWEARSSRRASQVGEDAARLFFDRLQLAETDLWQATELDPLDAAPWAFLVISARGLQHERAEEERRFEEAQKRNPESHVAHSMMLVALCEKWGGSHAAMFAFAREASAKAPEGSGLHALVAQAHVERWLYFLMEEDRDGAAAHFSDPGVRAEVAEAWARSFGSPACRAGRFAQAQRSQFAVCFFLADERALLREALSALGPVVVESPWGFLDDPVKAFRRARAACGL